MTKKTVNNSGSEDCCDRFKEMAVKHGIPIMVGMGGFLILAGALYLIFTNIEIAMTALLGFLTILFCWNFGNALIYLIKKYAK